MRYISKTVIGIFILSVFSSAQSSYAPWAKLSDDAPEEIKERNYPVPLKSEVDIPPYPGAVLTSVSAPNEDTTKYHREALPFIILVTTKSPDEVIQFYKAVLSPEEGWQYTEEYKGFVKGEILSALTGFVPGVGIREENGEEFDLVYVDKNLRSELKTRIKIFYKPIRNQE